MANFRSNIHVGLYPLKSVYDRSRPTYRIFEQSFLSRVKAVKNRPFITKVQPIPSTTSTSSNSESPNKTPLSAKVSAPSKNDGCGSLLERERESIPLKSCSLTFLSRFSSLRFANLPHFSPRARTQYFFFFFLRGNLIDRMRSLLLSTLKPSVTHSNRRKDGFFSFLLPLRLEFAQKMSALIAHYWTKEYKRKWGEKDGEGKDCVSF